MDNGNNGGNGANSVVTLLRQRAQLEEKIARLEEKLSEAGYSANADEVLQSAGFGDADQWALELVQQKEEAGRALEWIERELEEHAKSEEEAVRVDGRDPLKELIPDNFDELEAAGLERRKQREENAKRA